MNFIKQISSISLAFLFTLQLGRITFFYGSGFGLYALPTVEETNPEAESKPVELPKDQPANMSKDGVIRLIIG